ncbi:MAG: OmpA family protein [Bacteroidales bacterium]
MTRKTVLIIFILSMGIQIISAQNLIPNPGFEEKEIKSYDKSGKYFRAKNWEWIQPRGQFGWWQMPWSGLHIDQTMLPYIDSLLSNRKTNKAFITIYPYSGNCYIRSLGCKYKNVIQVKLKQAVQKGIVYYFEMYYRIDAEYYKNEKVDPFLINETDFGIFFSNKNAFDIAFMNDLYKNKIIIKPQIPIKLYDSIPIKGWTKFAAYYSPPNNYSYFMIGNFRDLGQNNPKIFQNITNFYIDNLVLKPYESLLTKDLQSTDQAFVLQGIYFKKDEAVYSEKSLYTLDLLLNFLKNNPKKNIEISSYTVNNPDNGLLSQQRAQAIADFMINHGIKPNRMNATGKDLSRMTSPKPTTELTKIERIELIIKL